MIDDWVYKKRVNETLLGLVDLEESEKSKLWHFSEDNGVSCVEPLFSSRSMPWDFGEEEQSRLLQSLFPIYERAVTSSRHKHTGSSTTKLPYNGRYIIRLLLTQVDFDAASIRLLIPAVLQSPFMFDQRVLALAVLSEACDNQLPVPSALAETTPDGPGVDVLAFFFGELWHNDAIARDILFRVSYKVEQRGFLERKKVHVWYLSEFLQYQGLNILQHLDKLEAGGEASVEDDTIFNTLYTHMMKDYSTRSQSPQSTGAPREALDSVRRWFAGFCHGTASSRDDT